MTIDATTIVAWLLSSSLVGAISGSVVNHLLTLWRDSTKRREGLNIERRISAWKSLERAAFLNVENFDLEVENKLKGEFDYALAEVILLGTSHEVELAQRYAKEASEIGNAEALTDLLNELRAALRSELGLEKVPTSQFYFRSRRRKPD
ncbi:MAG: hypothetical protein P4L98_13835 [Ancalomicrobiaceae bacterium]|nr:hypothetical protein [Ancalomicrobiaceae bacterium]